MLRHIQLFSFINNFNNNNNNQSLGKELKNSNNENLSMKDILDDIIRQTNIKLYFNSKCFYWVDAGYFTNSNTIDKYINWPSTKKCFEDPRVLLNSIRIVPYSERKALLSFNLNAHKKFQRKANVGGGVFGGQSENLMKFIDYYYETIKLFISHKIFIGKDQNLFAFVAFSHPEIINLVQSGEWRFFQKYLS